MTLGFIRKSAGLRARARRRAGRATFLTALSQILLAAALGAQSLPAQVDCNAPVYRGRVALVASGGISKGAYQAGALWGFLQAERALRDQTRDSAIRIDAITGASAGNVNSLLASVEWSTAIDASRNEESSLLWQVWTSLGVEKLLPVGAKKESVISALSHTALDPAIDLASASQRLSLLNCEIRIAISMTRFDSATIVKIQGLRDVAVLRHVSKALYQSSATGWRLTKLGDSLSLRGPGVQMSARAVKDSIDFDDFKSHVLASAAFPFAFPPRRVAASRTSGDSLSGVFVDGGVFDNEPIDVGEALLQLSPGCSANCVIVFASPNRRLGVAQLPSSTTGGPGVHSVIETPVPAPLWSFLDFAQLIRRAAADAEVARLRYQLDSGGNSCTNPTVTSRVCLVTSERRRAIFGSTAGSFGGFLGKNFLEYDFYVGVYDGLCAHARTFRSSLATRNEQCDPATLARLTNDTNALPELSKDGHEILRWLHCLEIANDLRAGWCSQLLRESSGRVRGLAKLGALLEEAAETWELRERTDAELRLVELALKDSANRDSTLAKRMDSLKVAAKHFRDSCPTKSGVVAFYCAGGLFQTIREYSSWYQRLSDLEKGSLEHSREFAEMLKNPEITLFLYALEATRRLRVVEESQPTLTRRVVGGLMEFSMSKQSSGLTSSRWRPFHSENGFLYSKPTLSRGAFNRVLMHSFLPLTATFGKDRRRPSEIHWAPLGGFFPADWLGIGPMLAPRRLLSSDRRLDLGVRTQLGRGFLSGALVVYCPVSGLGNWSRCEDLATGQIFFSPWRVFGVGLEWRGANQWRDPRVLFAFDDVSSLLNLYARLR